VNTFGNCYIDFNRPYSNGQEIGYIHQAIANMHLSGDGLFTKKCHAWLEKQVGCCRALLTHSCTAALEMAALLTNILRDDEIIMSSFTFVSTANAFVLRGGVPVFVDIRDDTLNIDERKIEEAITPRTKAIVPVHYAGVACDMDVIMEIAGRHKLIVIEDAAQGIMSDYKGRPVGSIGHLAAFSFHETKNVICGEGGALLMNDLQWVKRAEIIREKGTNRAQFLRGEVNKYGWMDLGSSYLPSEINAAFLWAQLEEAEAITQRRRRVWQQYHEAFVVLEAEGKVRRPIIPTDCQHNAHMYYLLLPDMATRTELMKELETSGVNAVCHYVPLHSSQAGKKYGRIHDHLSNTEDLSSRLLRLPLWMGMTENQVKQVVDSVYKSVN